MKAKSIKGMVINKANIGVVMSEFLNYVNKGESDVSLSSTYEKVMKYHLQAKKDEII